MGTLKNPHAHRKEKGTEFRQFPLLWYGLVNLIAPFPLKTDMSMFS